METEHVVRISVDGPRPEDQIQEQKILGHLTELQTSLTEMPAHIIGFRLTIDQK